MVLSTQAARLHAIAVTRAGSAGLIGRAEAEHIASTCGALVDELVEAGLWLQNDLSYVVRAGALMQTRPTPDDGVSSPG